MILLMSLCSCLIFFTSWLSSTLSYFATLWSHFASLLSSFLSLSGHCFASFCGCLNWQSTFPCSLKMFPYIDNSLYPHVSVYHNCWVRWGSSHRLWAAAGFLGRSLKCLQTDVCDSSLTAPDIHQTDRWVMPHTHTGLYDWQRGTKGGKRKESKERMN